MKRKATLIAGLGVVILCAATVVTIKHQGKREVELAAEMTQREAAPAPSREEASPGVKPSAVEPLPAETSQALLNADTQSVAEAVVQPLNVKTQKVGQVQKPKTKTVIQDPLAREALAMVGVDPEAEAYWFGAIHDSTLPKSERQDLIDDLNEAGLPDPKHPTLNDVPLLLSRIEILEELVPSLTDEFEWKESYDDLVNLVELAMGGGKPVQ